ncbi:MAG: hypothetical protein GC145_00155 [Caulobacter sp.]|nr:hypothetical protein [Caulobacter sp.]
MTLALLARFHTQSEAQIAASMLQSAGLAPVLFDLHYGGVDWVAQSALGGYRLMLPAAEIDDGRTLLREGVSPAEPVDQDACPSPPGSLPVTVAALAAMVVVGAEAGWLISGVRKRQLPSMPAVLIGTFLAIAALIAGSLALILLIRVGTSPP